MSPLRFVFETAPTQERYGMRREVEVTAEDVEQLQELAPHFGLEPSQWREFLRRLVCWELPNQPRNAPEEESFASQIKAEHIAFTCFEPELARRVERAAVSLWSEHQ